MSGPKRNHGSSYRDRTAQTAWRQGASAQKPGRRQANGGQLPPWLQVSSGIEGAPKITKGAEPTQKTDAKRRHRRRAPTAPTTARHRAPRPVSAACDGPGGARSADLGKRLEGSLEDTDGWARMWDGDRNKGWMRNEVPGRARNQPDWGEYRHSGPPYLKGTWSRTPSGRLSPRGLPGHFPNLPSCDTGSPIKQAQYEINYSDNKTERL